MKDKQLIATVCMGFLFGLFANEIFKERTVQAKQSSFSYVCEGNDCRLTVNGTPIGQPISPDHASLISIYLGNTEIELQETFCGR